MRGADEAKQAVVERLETVLPACVIRVAERKATTLALPGLYSITDRASIDVKSYPAVLVQAVGIEGLRAVAIEADGITYEVRYRVRVHVLTHLERSDALPEAELERDRLLLALTECLLAAQELGVDATDDETTLSARFGDAYEDAASLLVVPGYLELVVTLVEDLEVPPLSVADTTFTTTSRLERP